MLMSALPALAELENPPEFVARHIGPWDDDEAPMLSAIGAASRRALIDAIVPRSIDRTEAMRLPMFIAAATYGKAAAIAIISGVASALLVRRQLGQLDLIGVLKSSE